MPLAEIIAIGTELTTGAKLDTNSQWLSVELQAVGIPVQYHVTVADDMTANVNVLRTAVDRSDIVLISGGLGPTLDDLTRDALAQLIGKQLVLHEPSLAIIRGMFARRNREMPERNVVQAMFPEGAEPIPNRRGTAPGIYLEIVRPGRPACRVAAMPGVPSEMKVMFHDDVLPRIRPPDGAGRVIRSARVNCFGLGESAAEQMLGDVTARGRDPEVGITVHEATITLRIESTAATIAEALEKIAATKKIIFERMGDYAFGEEDEELEDVIVRLLNERAQSLAVAEAATGGLVAHRLTNVPRHECCLRGGLVAPDERTLEPASGANSADDAAVKAAASRLAQSCRERFAADWGLSVGRCSRADDHEGAPDAPTVWLALADSANVRAVELNVAGDPAILKSRVAKSALNLLRLALLR
ncbi:MAG: CinA family nicotinamide mononucleotide deamidase-related protein [Planctomycetia bacterium]|nr:CinA family nicotinamide mononucleotide deamidase-related protein [Planctomycetia bacterium]